VEDSTVAARLKTAGAILLGKTNGPLIWPESRFPLPTNPYHPERQTGASAGGPAAAVAAGLTALDVGLDTNGSILQPAAYCGVIGVRPTEHRIPLTGSFFIDPIRKSRVMTVAGPLARSVHDLRLALQVLIGPDGHDTHTVPVPWREPLPLDLRHVRLAWTPTLPQMLIAADVRAAIERFAQQVASLGVSIEEHVPAIDFAEQARLGNDLFFLIAGTFESRNADTPPASLEEYLTALHQRDHYMRIWDDFFAAWDALICPVTPITADGLTDTVKRVDGKEVTVEERPTFFMATSLASVSGCPAVVILIARDRDGLPVAVQILGRRWHDERLLAIAELLFEVVGGFQPPQDS
jgi:amidase